MFLFGMFLLFLITLKFVTAVDFNLASRELTTGQQAFLSDPLWTQLLALSGALGTTKADLEALITNTFLDPLNYQHSTLPPASAGEAFGVHCETSGGSPEWLDITVLVSDLRGRPGGVDHWGPGCSEQASFRTAHAGTCADWSYTTAWGLYAWRVWTIATSCLQFNRAGGRFVFHREEEAWSSDQRLY